MKQAQISIFLIVGILVVLAVSLFVYFYARDQTPQITQQIIQEAPTELRPVQDYVEQCIADITQIGLQKLGEHGGYIDPAQFGIYGASQATESNGVDLFSGANFVVPYWHHLASQNDCQNPCIFSSEEPPLTIGDKSIQSQLNAYVNTHLTDCTKQFAPLNEQGILVEPQGLPDADVQLLRTGGIAKVSWPLKVTIADTIRSYKDFSSPIDIKFPQIYTAAELLTQIQSRAKVFESHTKNVITAFSGIDRDKLPPMWATDMRIGKQVSWPKSQVEEKLKNLLSSQVSLVQVATSKNYQYRPQSTKLGESLYNSGTLIPGNDSFSNYEITFSFLPNWNIYFDLDCNGGVCEPQSAFNDFLPIVGLTRYTFAYDLSYPVLVTIYDPAAFYGQGYTFQYVVEVNLRNNEALATDFVPVHQIAMGGGKELCQEQHKTAGPVVVHTNNMITGQAIPELTIGFDCASTGCTVGQTNQQGVLQSKFPSCINGQISAISADYFAESQTLTTLEDVSNDVNINAWPISDVPFTVKKWNIVKTENGWISQNNAVDLESYEEVIITLKRKSQGASFVALGQFKDGAPTIDMKLIPGDYELSAQVLSYASVNIAQDERCYGGITENCFTMPGASFNQTNPLLVGTVKADITITPQMLEGLTFFVPALDFAHTSNLVMEDLAQPARINWESDIFQPVGGLS